MQCLHVKHLCGQNYNSSAGTSSVAITNVHVYFMNGSIKLIDRTVVAA